MKFLSVLRASFVVMFLCAGSVPAMAASTSPGTRAFLSRYSYDPSVIYAGTYGSNVLYYHNHRNPNWYRGFKKELDAVSCPPAIAGLRSNGTWKGHLNQDGSCADQSEPVEWALGNRLNFDRIAPQATR